MKTIKIGDRGDYVILLQRSLKDLGFLIEPDGKFGNNTEDAVIEFQKQNNLDDDGIVGENTWNLLLECNSETPKINDTKFVLPEYKYFPEKNIKTNIVLHHTNGWTVVKGTKDRPSMNHFNWWVSQQNKISTAFSIDYKGNIYQHYNPLYWAYHLGLGSRNINMDKQSIGIEFVNEGQMSKEEDKYYWHLGDMKLPYNREDDQPIYVNGGWRGFYYFAPYSNEQFDSGVWLVKHLCKKYNIKNNMIDDCNYHPEIISDGYEGVYCHANVRKYPSKHNKHDLSPAFPFEDFKTLVVG